MVSGSSSQRDSSWQKLITAFGDSGLEELYGGILVETTKENGRIFQTFRGVKPQGQC